MKIFSSKRRVVAAVAIVLLLLFFLRPGASRLKSRIITSLSAAVGRPVDIGSVHVRLLPRPGFDLENLVVYDDAAFGAEPMLRASEVTASLRLTSLLRARLEIARLELTEPSLNLVRAENGRWNLEALLERAAHIPLAPTAKAKSEARPGFPYIQATSARINFKNGAEKKPYALTNTDFSLWQDSENTWGVRLKGTPLRTDLNLNDTGILLVNGTWQRAPALRDTPLDFSVEWSRAQLGQLTKLLTGSDRGWRGGVQLDLTLKGTPAKLQIASDTAVQDFRRHDITSGEPLRLAAHCESQYSAMDRLFREISCMAPTGEGEIALKGSMGLPGSHIYDLTLVAENVPATGLIALARRAKKSLPDDLTAGGSVQGNVAIHEDGGTTPQLRVDGKGEIRDFRLASKLNDAALGPETIPFVLKSDGAMEVRKRNALGVAAARVPAGPRLEVGPFPIAIGHSVTARGWGNHSAYDFLVSGDADITKSLRAARLFGLPAVQTAAEGYADVELHVAGSWSGWSYGVPSGFALPQINGTAKLHNVHIPLRGTSALVEVSSADMRLNADGVHVTKLNAKTADTIWSGSIEMPRGCGTPGACAVRFDLAANQISLGDLSNWASPHSKQRAWYQILGDNTQRGPSLLGSLRASGTIKTERLQAQNLAATRVSAKVVLEKGKARVTELKADALGGTHSGEWQGDFTASGPTCAGTGKFTALPLEQLGELMKDAWIAGTANASYDVKGPCTAQFWQAAEGALQFDIKNGVLPHISLIEDSAALRISRLSGTATLQQSTIDIKDAMLDSPSGRFQVNGTAGLDRSVELKLTPLASGEGAGYAIGGTIAEPRVTALTKTEQAKLKSDPAK